MIEAEGALRPEGTMTSAEAEEVELVRRAQAGDAWALEVLVERLLPVVVARARRLGGRRVDPEDAAQDALWQIMNHVAELRDPSAFRSWAFQITRRVVDKHRRRAWLTRWVGPPQDEIEDWSQVPGRTVEQRERARLVQRILERIPRDQVEVLLLVKVEGHTLPETAALVGVPVGTATSRLRLAIARFTKLARRLGLEPDLSPLYETELA